MCNYSRSVSIETLSEVTAAYNRVARAQATIHMSLPRHQNIVTLYQTLQTKKWLFLLLEMCPGEDLSVAIDCWGEKDQQQFSNSRY